MTDRRSIVKEQLSWTGGHHPPSEPHDVYSTLIVRGWEGGGWGGRLAGWLAGSLGWHVSLYSVSKRLRMALQHLQCLVMHLHAGPPVHLCTAHGQLDWPNKTHALFWTASVPFAVEEIICICMNPADGGLAALGAMKLQGSSARTCGTCRL